MSWLGVEYKDKLNRIVLYITTHGDDTSDTTLDDSLYIYVNTYGMRLVKKVAKVGSDVAIQFGEEIEMPLGTIGTPVGSTNVTLQARANQWLITETRTYFIELQAYLLEEGPEEMLVRTF